ncbi:hypothetical protein QOL99_01790 [Deinococcus sp. MIMF12]|uniref:Uncharacterized protein n=1 Tax=Deinococcus rhizophilus TaxID=3049544 RepID=A0ABT7JEG8_9DEIO|nr:hypothetical protein [Deinococcus rhizophilus]MDL2342873.1 hypothetical protein [Deinococcus rhizophilus]
MFDPILIPINGNPVGLLAPPVAAELARCHQGTLTVLLRAPKTTAFTPGRTDEAHWALAHGTFTPEVRA